jgi:uncharacterized membrane protein YqjE
MSAETGLFDALRRVAGTAVSMLQSRIELASLELGEAGRRVFTTVLVAFFAVLLLLSAVVLASVWLVMLLWPVLGATSLGLFALAYAVSGVLMLRWVQRRFDAEPPLLEATLNELRSDASLLRSTSSTSPPR